MAEKDKKEDLPGRPSDQMDAYEPSEIAERVLYIGVKKTRYPIYKTFTLGLMGGAFISIGALYELYVLSHPEISQSTALLITPFFYAIGYIMAFLSGAEVFTTNNLSAMGWVSGKLSLYEITRNWTIVLFANLAGAVVIGGLYFFSGLIMLNDAAIIDTAKIISAHKLSYGPLETIIIGVFGNIVICIGLWLAMGGRSLLDRFFVMLVPVAAVPALNFQHCTGNMIHYILALLTTTENVDLDLPAQITFWSVTSNLGLVAFGNIVGGGILIAVVYYFAFIREESQSGSK
ncbi:MAG: formate/nitrite transporter family protein [Balneolales bacterium]|nr:formate/nitrite transporter family protein [Balneolales bacterium]